MKDRGSNSPVAWSLEVIKETITSTGILSPSRALNNARTTKAPEHDTKCSLEQELHDLCSIGEDVLLSDDAEANKTPETFAGHGSFTRLRSDFYNTRYNGMKAGMSSEAPAKLGRDYTRAAADSLLSVSGVENVQYMFGSMSEPRSTRPVDIVQNGKRGEEQCRARRKLYKQKSWSSEVDHDEAWERRKDRLSLEHSNTATFYRGGAKKLGRCVSDCGDTTWPNSHGLRSVSRTRSLTDEDLDELRGCIDLGFGFSNQANPKLWDTLPALELCYAISQQLKDEQSRLSPVSVLEKNALDSSANASSQTGSPATGSWLISSPGDHPQEVKERLRHWAQAVAFTVRQGY